MGTRVDFYILSTITDEERYQYACRLIEKVFHQGNRVYIHTNDENHAEFIDDLLWSFRDTSFIPHAIIGADRVESVMIGYGGHQAPDGSKVWVNLSDQMPLLTDNSTRVVEILPKEGPVTTAGRERYRQYTLDKFEINTHKIGGAT